MNRSTGLEGVHGTTNAFDLERARQPGRSIFLSDPVRPVGGVEDADGVHDARPSVLYAPTGP